MSTIETTTAVTASSSSGGTCSTPGPYLCTTHTDTVLFFDKGQTFSNCPISRSKKGHSTTWTVMNDAAAKDISTVDKLDSTAL